MQSVKLRVEEKKVTGFTDTEEEAGGLTKVVPLLLEDELEAEGGMALEGCGLAPLCRSLGFGRSARLGVVARIGQVKEEI